MAQGTGFMQGCSFSVKGEDIYQRLLGSNHIPDEAAPTDVILEISTHFHFKPVKEMWLGNWDLSPGGAKTRRFSAEVAASADNSQVTFSSSHCPVPLGLRQVTGK